MSSSSSNVSTGLSINLSTGDVQSGHTQFRNRIINGDMRIDQRYNGNGTLQTGISTTGYYIDRFYISMSQTGGTMKVGQNVLLSTDIPYQQGLRYSYRYEVQTIPSSVTFMNFGQLIEGLNVADFMWGTNIGKFATLSFWYKSSNAGYHCVAFRNDQSGGSSVVYTAPFFVNTANTWQYFMITVPSPPSGTTWGTGTSAGITILFAETYNRTPTNTSVNQWVNGGNDCSYNLATIWNNAIGGYVELTGVQFEKGTQATPFEFRPISIELQLCQRYYQQLTPNVSTANSSDYYYSLTTGTGEVRYPLPVAMRATPTPSTVTSTNAAYSTSTQMLRMYTTVAPGSIYFKSLTAEL